MVTLEKLCRLVGCTPNDVVRIIPWRQENRPFYIDAMPVMGWCNIWLYYSALYCRFLKIRQRTRIEKFAGKKVAKRQQSAPRRSACEYMAKGVSSYARSPFLKKAHLWFAADRCCSRPVRYSIERNPKLLHSGNGAAYKRIFRNSWRFGRSAICVQSACPQHIMASCCCHFCKLRWVPRFLLMPRRWIWWVWRNDGRIRRRVFTSCFLGEICHRIEWEMCSRSRQQWFCCPMLERPVYFR